MNAVILIVILVWFSNGKFATTTVQSQAGTLELCQKNVALDEANLLNDKTVPGVEDVQIVCVSGTKRPRV